MTEEDEEHRELLSIEGHFTDLGAAISTPPQWIVESLATAGLTFIIGPAKDAYKTTTAMALMARIAGLQCSALPPEWKALIKGPVLVFEAEADEGELLFMMKEGLGVTVPADERIMIAQRPEEFRLDNPDAVDQMIHWIEERNPAAVMIDPLVNFHSLDEKESAEMIQILMPLRREAKRRGMGIFILHHTRKIEEGKLYTAADARGSSAIMGLVDNMIVMSPGKQEFEIVFERKGKKGSTWQRAIKLGIWSNKGAAGQEVLSALDKMIIKSVMHGFNTTQKLFTDLKMPTKQFNTALHGIISRGHLKEVKHKDRTHLEATGNYKLEDL